MAHNQQYQTSFTEFGWPRGLKSGEEVTPISHALVRHGDMIEMQGSQQYPTHDRLTMMYSCKLKYKI